MNSKIDRWGPQVHSGSPLRPQKSMRRVFYKRDNKIKRLIDEIKQQRMDRTTGVKVRNVVKPDTHEHGYYDVEPAFGINGVYRIQEHMLSEFEFYRVQYANRNIKDEAAKFIYERGKTKQPREYGYIGRIRYTPEGNRKTYNLRDRRAIRINQIVLNTLFHGEIDKRNYEDNHR